MTPERQLALSNEFKIITAEAANADQTDGDLANLNEAHSRIVCEVETLVHEVRKTPRHRNPAAIKTSLRRIAAQAVRAAVQIKFE